MFVPELMHGMRFVATLIAAVELSLTVPIVNTLAFLFTVIGEWWVEKKVISRGELSPQANIDLPNLCPVGC